MPRLETRYFGTVEYDDQAVFFFPGGLPGFEEERRFLPVEVPASKPLLFLQSLGAPDLCFLTLPVRTVEPAYRLKLEPAERAVLGLAEDREPEIGRDLLCLVLVTLTEGQHPTANLFAPLVVHLETRVALQAMQFDSDYSHQHPIPAPGPREARC